MVVNRAGEEEGEGGIDKVTSSKDQEREREIKGNVVVLERGFLCLSEDWEREEG